MSLINKSSKFMTIFEKLVYSLTSTLLKASQAFDTSTYTGLNIEMAFGGFGGFGGSLCSLSVDGVLIFKRIIIGLRLITLVLPTYAIIHECFTWNIAGLFLIIAVLPS